MLTDPSSNKKRVYSVKKESFIDLFDDGKYVMYLGRFESGTYVLKGSSVLFTSDSGHQWSVDLNKDQDKKVAYFKLPEEYEPSDPVLTMNWMPHRFEVNYPFTAEWNKWRKGEDSRLTKNQLIDKVQNYITYIKKYIIWCNKEKIKVELIDVSGPLRFANNGFMLRNRSQTGDWCSYFKEGDCIEMDYILRNHFDGLEINWKKTSNKLMVLTDGLDQLKSGLDNYRESED
jgi:hypothetical protein